MQSQPQLQTQVSQATAILAAGTGRRKQLHRSRMGAHAALPSCLAALTRDAARVVGIADPLDAVHLHARLFTATRMREALGQVLADRAALDRIGARSYVHDNGFAKLVLVERGFKLRLHYRPAAGVAAGAENIHDHRWNFLSNVLFGELAVQKFQRCAESAPGAMHVLDCQYRARQVHGQSYGVIPQGLAHVRHVSTDILAAHSTYFLDGAVMHRLVARPGSSYATLVLTHPPFATTTRLMPTGDYAREVAVTPMSPSQLASTLEMIIQALETSAKRPRPEAHKLSDLAALAG